MIKSKIALLGIPVFAAIMIVATILPAHAVAVEVALDIKPGSCPNPINTHSKGVLPVAILGTENFDVTQIDVSTIRLVGASPIRDNIEDVGTPLENNNHVELDPTHCSTEPPDGIVDLVLKFRTQDVIAGIGECNTFDIIRLDVAGNFFDGTPFRGHDVVIIMDS